MPHLSRKRLDKETYRQVLDTLDEALGKLKKEEIRTFLFSLMSGTERLMVAKRFVAVALLYQGLDDKTIAETLNMTRSTVNKLTLIAQVKNQGFNLAVKKLRGEKKKQEAKKILLGIAKESADLFFNWRIKPPNDYPK